MEKSDNFLRPNRTYRRSLMFKYRTYRIFLTFRTEHTESRKSEHTEAFLHSEPNIPNLAKPNIPKLSYFLDRTYRQFLSFETNHTKQTEHADHFLRRNSNIPNISCVVFDRSSQLGRNYFFRRPDWGPRSKLTLIRPSWSSYPVILRFNFEVWNNFWRWEELSEQLTGKFLLRAQV